jgi:hypothetical protein
LRAIRRYAPCAHAGVPLMEDSSPRSKRTYGWWLLGFACLTLTTLSIGIAVRWYYDDDDLVAVRAEARRQGTPTTWDEMGLTATDDARLGLWKRVSTLSKALKSYQAGPGTKAGAPAFKPFAPIPAELRAHHAGLDAASMAELMTLLDQLGDQPLVLHREMTYSTLLPEIGINRELIRLLQERVALADAAEVPALCRRMLALCRRYSADCLIQHLVHCSIIEIALAATTTRLNDLKQTDPTVAEAVLAATQDLPAGMAHALQGEFLCSLAMVNQRGFYNLGEEPASNWFMPITVRIGRRGMLTAQLAAITRLRHDDLTTALAWARTNEAFFTAAKRGIPTPTLILQGMFAPSYPLTIAMGHRTALRGRLLAAEIRGRPWPSDSFDPSGVMLRPFMRNGTLVGAYSVDTDGHDDGGDAKKDHYFPLYGPRELSKPTTPPP